MICSLSREVKSLKIVLLRSKSRENHHLVICSWRLKGKTINLVNFLAPPNPKRRDLTSRPELGKQSCSRVFFFPLLFAWFTFFCSCDIVIDSLSDWKVWDRFVLVSRLDNIQRIVTSDIIDPSSNQSDVECEDQGWSIDGNVDFWF